MSSKLLDLEDRIVTDDGQVFYKHDFFLDKARSGEPFTDYKACEEHRDLVLWNERVDKDVDPIIEFWEDDGVVTGPADDTFDWTIPEEYQTLDVAKAIADAFDEKIGHNHEQSTKYVIRLVDEHNEMEKRGMLPFVRCLIYIRDKFRENNVVWGVGRGSSCACLIFWLLDINRVDPVKYDIPMEEFFKPQT